MGNCCRGESSTSAVAGGDGTTPPPPKNNHRGIIKQCSSDGGDQNYGASSGSCCSSSGKVSKEVKIRMTKQELEELVGWLNMADSSFEHVMTRLVNVVISDHQSGSEEDDNNVQVVKLRQQSSWRPSLRSIPEIN